VAGVERGAVTIHAGSAGRAARLLTLVLLLSVPGIQCDQMADQPRYEAFEARDVSPTVSSARQPVPGTVAQGHARLDDHLYRGMVNDQPARTFPFEITKEDVQRGRERYGVFCAHCHGLSGHGDGMIIQRGFTQPPSYHTRRLRDAPVGHFFDVITNGFGAMYSHDTRVPVRDRWRIVAYIRALQLSQHAELEALPEKDRQEIKEVDGP